MVCILKHKTVFSLPIFFFLKVSNVFKENSRFIKELLRPNHQKSLICKTRWTCITAFREVFGTEQSTFTTYKALFFYSVTRHYEEAPLSTLILHIHISMYICSARFQFFRAVNRFCWLYLDQRFGASGIMGELRRFRWVPKLIRRWRERIPTFVIYQLHRGSSSGFFSAGEWR